MKNVSIYGKKWLDLVFEGKNKEYGAYKLRQEDNKTTLTAFILSVSFVLILIGGGLFLSSFGKKPVVAPVVFIPVIPVNLSVINHPKTDLPKKIEKQVAVKKPEVKIPENKPLVVVKTEEAIEPVTKTSELPKTVVPIANEGGSDTGTSPNTGKPTTGGSDFGTGKSTSGPVSTTELDRQPMFPGGMQRFGEYVGNHFEKSEMEENQTVKIYVSFIIEVDGSMTSIQVNRKGIEKLDNEAIRVLKSLRTKWSAGYKDNQPVRTQFTLPITVQAE